jgi:hypothetical protein
MCILHGTTTLVAAGRSTFIAASRGVLAVLVIVVFVLCHIDLLSEIFQLYYFKKGNFYSIL